MWACVWACNCSIHLSAVKSPCPPAPVVLAAHAAELQRRSCELHLLDRASGCARCDNDGIVLDIAPRMGADTAAPSLLAPGGSPCLARRQRRLSALSSGSRGIASRRGERPQRVEAPHALKPQLCSAAVSPGVGFSLHAASTSSGETSRTKPGTGEEEEEEGPAACGRRTVKLRARLSAAALVPWGYKGGTVDWHCNGAPGRMQLASSALLRAACRL